MNSQRVIIIGGGIVGLATAYRLGRRYPGGVGSRQTGHYSGDLHRGMHHMEIQ